MSNTLSDDKLQLLGVSENNLKHVDLTIQHNKLIAVTGVSGSGKSSLAFSTIYAEGGRRYIETFSPYTRQFLDRLPRPQIDAMHGVRPALALEQRNRITNSRSTVGTVTEINDYLKIIWAELATPYCPNCNIPVQKHSPHDIYQELVRDFKKPVSCIIVFPISISGKAKTESLIEILTSQGFLRYFSHASKTVKRVEELHIDELKDTEEVLIALDRIQFDSEANIRSERERITSSLAQAYTYGHGRVGLILQEQGESSSQTHWYSQQIACPQCHAELAPPRPSLFSFNSPLGACNTCHGFGNILTIDPELCVPDERISIKDGALAPWSSPSTRHEFKKLLAFCETEDVDINIPWASLSEAARKKIFEGEKKAKGFRGVRRWFEKLQRKVYKMHVRVFLARYRSQVPCPDCKGSRLRPDALNYRLNDNTLPMFWALPIEEALQTLESFQSSETSRQEFIELTVSETLSRLKYLNDIGLGYLTLDRQARTLSGGECQRVNLTSILGSRLVNTTLVLDEPTVGLHPRDTSRLISGMKDLRDAGNSVIVVEHDPEVMASADEIIDLGPNAGAGGGNIVYQGPVSGIGHIQDSKTGQYLSGRQETPPTSAQELSEDSKSLVLLGARANNLKHIDISIPLGGLVVLTGVSGSGKSSLIQECLEKTYERLQAGTPLSAIVKSPQAVISGFEGLKHIDEIVLVDQSPIGKTPRANPGTYTKVWESIRECLANTDEASRLGLGKSAFSFNVPGGRCPTCEGSGAHRVEMQFLADVFVTCEACGGSRFQDRVLSVRFAGKNVQEFLQLTLDETFELFQNLNNADQYTKICEQLSPLVELGLGYLRLGQPLSEVSGGEAQRIKLASYLKREEKRKCLFILDEPTTGLHPYNISQLLHALRHLISYGHSVFCVEHNLDVIANADWMIDLGPESGERGGELVLSGRPSELIRSEKARKKSITVDLLAAYQEQRDKTLHLNGTKQSKTGKKQQADVLQLPASRTQKSSQKNIEVRGAREHNLKNIHLDIPHNALTVMTGVSGSGKSTLAFDIIFSEGQRRYIDCLSPYARQYITQLKRAEVDSVRALPPTVAISQKTAPPLGISTLATVTELYQFLRLLYSKVGTQHCPDHHIPISNSSAESLAAQIAEQYAGKRVFIFAPVVSGRKGVYNDLFQRAVRAEISEARVDKKIISLHPELRLERHKLHWISLLIGSITSPEKNVDLLREAIDQALLFTDGTLEIAIGDKKAAPEILSTARSCPKCKKGFRELDPQDFSFRSARGVCTKCSGYGFIERMKKRVVERTVCPECDGARIGIIGRNVFINKQPIFSLTQMTAPELLDFLEQTKFPQHLDPVVSPVLHELVSRLKLIRDIGLDYLALDRDASTISGGEAQRLRLARTIGSPMSGICYVLDEPTIGLHPADHSQLMQTLRSIRDSGNTVIVVEHDEETILEADYVVDLGPEGGRGGGNIVAQGSVAELLQSEKSPTGLALRERIEKTFVMKPDSKTKKTQKSTSLLEISGACANNLKRVSCSIPLGQMTVVAGVSGAGKSSLVHGCLVPAASEALDLESSIPKGAERPWKKFEVHESLNRVIEIDQSPVGKTSASTPASFLGIFDSIRKLYAITPEAKARGWTASHFSYNSGKGKCPNCAGKGMIKIPMSFLPDATSPCEVCNGLRYTDQTLDILYQGVSIGHLLQKTMTEARETFANHPPIRRVLDYIFELGIGYLTLGQPTHTLSGGELQRLKIAYELGSREAVNTLYVLDEPTIGLHMTDVDRLLSVLRKLIEKGNSLIVIEHSLDVIRQADHLIEIGPGPGDAGGEILFAGNPYDLARGNISTPTKTYLTRPIGETALQLKVS